MKTHATSRPVTRRQFGKLAALGLGGLLLPGCRREAPVAPPAVAVVPPAAPVQAGSNWAGNVAYHASRFEEPTTVGEVQELVRSSQLIKPLGSRHSFSNIADTQGTLVAMGRFNRIGNVDRETRTVTVGSGVKYSDLCPNLLQQGYAVSNLASLPHISVMAGATGTHGSGTGNLATQIVGLEFVNGLGDVVRLREGDDDFNGAVVGLGALGLVTSVTLRVVPEFQVRQWVWENMPIDAYLENFGSIIASGYSVSGFTTWRDARVSEIWVKRRADAGDWNPGKDWFGATAAPRDRHPIVTMDHRPCTAQMGVPGPSWERLPHFRPDHPPSSRGRERQSEYFVRRRDGVAAIRAMYGIGPRIATALQISEIRTVLRDNLWMSMAYGDDMVAFHFTWTENDVDVAAAIPIVEEALRPFSPRAHHGKMTQITAEQFAAGYPRFTDFQRLVRRQDPEGKFRNDWLTRFNLV